MTDLAHPDSGGRDRLRDREKHIARITKRLAKRKEPSMGRCPRCGHEQQGAPPMVAMAHSMALDGSKCAKCGEPLFFTFTIGGNGRSVDEDIQTLLDLLAEHKAGPHLGALIEKWRKEAEARDDGTHGRTSLSTAAYHLRWCAEELEAAVQEIPIARPPEVLDALRWLVNIGYGVGRAGGEPESVEIEAALENGKNALEAAAIPSSPSAPELNLEPIKARALVATKGPWRAMQQGNSTMEDGRLAPIGEVEGLPRPWNPVWVGWQSAKNYFKTFLRHEDAEFVAHARADVPALIAEIERWRSGAASSSSAEPEKPQK